MTGTTSAASAAPSVQAGNATTVTWFAARDATGYTPKLVDAFDKQSTSIQISYQEQGAVSQDLHDKFLIVAAAKDASVDLISIDSPFAPEYAAAGWTIPADETLLPKDEQPKSFIGSLDALRYNGALYGVPWYLSGPGFFYRKDLLDAAGLKAPKSYDDLIATAKKMQTADVAGFVMQLPQTEGGIISWLEYLWGYGGDLVDDKLNITLDKGTAGVDSLQKILDVAKSSKKQREATEAIRWLTAPEQQRTYFLDGGFPPTRTAVLDDAAIQAKYPYAKAMQASFMELKSRPVTPFWSQMSADAVQPNFGATMSRQKTPDQAIKDMADAMRKIIKQ